MNTFSTGGHIGGREIPCLDKFATTSRGGRLGRDIVTMNCPPNEISLWQSLHQSTLKSSS